MSQRSLSRHHKKRPFRPLRNLERTCGLTAALLSMRDGFVHPTINLEQPDPECDLDYVALKGRRHAVDVALCNCIGFGSKNAALLLRRWRDG